MDEEQQRTMAQHLAFVQRAEQIAERLARAAGELIELQRVFNARGYGETMTDETLAYSRLGKSDLLALLYAADDLGRFLGGAAVDAQHRWPAIDKARRYAE